MIMVLSVQNKNYLADPVIEGIARLEFVDALWWPHLAQDQFCSTRGGAGWSWGQCGCHKDPCQTQFQFCRVPRMGGIKLQLLCGVRIELAVGSLPYTQLVWVEGVQTP